MKHIFNEEERKRTIAILLQDLKLNQTKSEKEVLKIDPKHREKRKGIRFY